MSTILLKIEEHPVGEKLLSLFDNKGAFAGLIIILTLSFIGIFSGLIAPYGPSEIFADSFKLPPIWQEGGSMKFILGTDDLGRDVLSRLIHGSKISLGIGFFVVLIALSFGTILGVLAGFYGGRVDRSIMRLIDAIMALPSILLAIVVVSILGPGLENAVIAVAVVAVPGFTRVVRAGVLAEKEKQYVMAAKTIGASDLYIMFFEILPNCLAPIIVQATLGFSDAILNAAALGFLGLGAQAPTPEWGTMLSDARALIESNPWLVTLPGLCILVTVLSFNLLGDGLRDVLDPKLKR